MAEFSASQAAFEGFRLARERPGAILIWAALLFVLNLAATALLVGLAGEELTRLSEIQASDEVDPLMGFRLLGRVAPAYLVALAVSLVAYAVLYAGVHRAAMRPEEGGPGFLKLGADERRVGAALLLVFLILVGAYVVTLLGAGILVGLASLLGGPVATLVTVLAIVAVIGGLLWLSVRLSLAVPTTFARRRMQVRAAWALTRGRFWLLFGAYLLAVLLAIVVTLLALVVFTALAVLLGGGFEAAGRLLNPDLSSLESYLTPTALLSAGFSAVVGALGTAITVGVTSDAYKQITRGDKASVMPAA